MSVEQLRRGWERWRRGCGAWFIAQNSKCQFVVVVFVVLHDWNGCGKNGAGVLYSANKMRCVYVYNVLGALAILSHQRIPVSLFTLSLAHNVQFVLCATFLFLCTQLKSIFLLSLSACHGGTAVVLCVHTLSRLSVYSNLSYPYSLVQSVLYPKHTHIGWYNHLSIWRPMYSPSFSFATPGCCCRCCCFFFQHCLGGLVVLPHKSKLSEWNDDDEKEAEKKLKTGAMNDERYVKINADFPEQFPWQKAAASDNLPFHMSATFPRWFFTCLNWVHFVCTHYTFHHEIQMKWNSNRQLLFFHSCKCQQ